MNWENAITYCEALSFAGYTDWRLPNTKELESITDDSLFHPTIDTNYFPDAHWGASSDASRYWSSTIYAYASPYAWYVDFYSGLMDASHRSEDYIYVRCVRGGQ